MSNQTDFLKRHSLVIGIILMFLLTWPVEFANSGLLPFEVPFMVAYLVGYGIVIATLIMTGLTLGGKGVVALLKRYLIWRVGWRWYIVAFLLPVSVKAITTYLSTWMTGAPVDFTKTYAYGFFGPDANFLLLFLPFLLSDAITNGEEIGWRGYVLPRLQAKYSALTSSLILGVIWSLWHLPKPAFLPQWDANVFGWYALGTIAVTVLYTWIYNNTRGSLLLVTLFHAATNAAGFFLPTAGTTAGALSTRIIDALLWVAVAMVVVVIAGQARLSRTEEKQVQSEAVPA
jgi:membrane protease YdiL (CAAX protease family)